MPEVFPSNSLPCQRILTILKLKRDSRLEAASIKFWEAYWGSNHEYTEENIRAALGVDSLFSKIELDQLWMAKDSAEVKDALKKTNAIALASGSFGAPWMVVRREDGQEQVIFGFNLDILWE